jgi:transposase
LHTAPSLPNIEYGEHVGRQHYTQNLLARGKARLQAVVAVMRKLLHALFAMFRSNQPYDGSKLCAVDLAVHAACA